MQGTPQTATVADFAPVELGLRFRADAPGSITAIRFYRGAADPAPHDVHLWDTSGTLLATASSPPVASPGWQDVRLARPVAIAPGATYVASYHAPNGGYASTPAGLANGYDRGPLHATGSVYRYGAAAYPEQSWYNGNYWVDVAFSPETSGPVESPPPINTSSLSLWEMQGTPQTATVADFAPVELGLRFRADAPGSITAIRFYRGAADPAPHDVHLWDTSGTLLATASSPPVASPGWQDVRLARPVAIAPGATYVASYHAPNGGYASTPAGLANGYDRGPLHATGSVYRYGAAAYPEQSWYNGNYWVDVAFSPEADQTNPPAEPPPIASTIFVNNSAELAQAMTRAVAGTQILLNPGVYQGDIASVGLTGSADQPIVIGAADPSRKPVIIGGSAGMYLSRPVHIRLENLIFDGASTGLNIDDGGITGSSVGVVLAGLEVRNTSYNGIKMSGIDQFTIRGVSVRNWTSDMACGIDLVGCHSGTITGVKLSNQDTLGYGLQMKGGSADITVSDSAFVHAGRRAIQIGGSTGLEFFRPSFQGYEARNITVEGNTIIGSQAAVAFASIDGATVRYNTIYRPTSWVLRILQENVTPGYIPSRGGIFTNNIVAFRSDEISVAVNVGWNTSPETFAFASNWWFNVNDPSASRPYLPTQEVSGTYGVDPLFEDAEGGNLRLRSGSPASQVGAFAPRA